jgi:putative sterol carrier protein
MTEPTSRFFEELGGRGHEVLLAKATGTVRLDLAEGRRTDRWLVSLDKGDVTVSHGNAAADCVVRMDRVLFDRVVAGRVNVLAALLRGLVTVEGKVELVVLLQRLFPGPPRGRGSGRAAGSAARSS